MKAAKIRFFLIAILFISGSSLQAVPSLAGFSAVLVKTIIDLRGINQFRSQINNQPGRSFNPGDLKIGSVFMTADNEARKVVNIYERNGQTVIETIEPRPEEVFVSISVPDFKVACDRSNIDISSLAEGVTLLPPGAGSKDMISSDFTAPADLDRSVTWLETDPDTENMDFIALNIDMPLWTQNISGEILESLMEKQNDALEKEKQDDGNVRTETGGTASLDVGASGEIRLIGTLRLAEPVVTGGLKMPAVTVTWVHDWWIIYHPEFHFTDGYAKAGFEAAQQFDFRLTGTIDLSAEVNIPLFALVAKDPQTGTVTLTVGFYAKIGLDGQISLSVEVSEFSKHNVNATCDLLWPFIPSKFSGNQSSYLNLAYRPAIAASAELRAGLYLGADFEIAGMTIISAEGGGGGYILVEGYMEPLGIMGFDTEIGGYGNFDDWILDLYAEAGAYMEVGVEILTIGIPIYEKKWPFWEWHKSWEF
ncbi:MAG: hypothetical protein JXR86_17550 [Spirochaetales bacterium]|nr:hypothetical protein [Spirochaetales bacterium]